MIDGERECKREERKRGGVRIGEGRRSDRGKTLVVVAIGCGSSVRDLRGGLAGRDEKVGDRGPSLREEGFARKVHASLSLCNGTNEMLRG